jgi:GH25 family lysozyme M1 (1,4-beta-N-acetylmuramidase)
MSKFLDLSEHNTILNYDLIGKADLKGVILKAREGTTFTDSTMEEKYNNLKDKTSLGFYHYLTVTSEPETQAEHFYSLIKDKEFEIIPVVDVEQDQLASKAEEYITELQVKIKFPRCNP